MTPYDADQSPPGADPCRPDPYASGTRLPAGFAILDPELDAHLDPLLFRMGYQQALARLDGMPPAWALHYASSTLAEPPDPDGEPSHTRGYRAALYGYVRHGRLRGTVDDED